MENNSYKVFQKVNENEILKLDFETNAENVSCEVDGLISNDVNSALQEIVRKVVDIENPLATIRNNPEGSDYDEDALFYLKVTDRLITPLTRGDQVNIKCSVNGELKIVRGFVNEIAPSILAITGEEFDEPFILNDELGGIIILNAGIVNYGVDEYGNSLGSGLELGYTTFGVETLSDEDYTHDPEFEVSFISILESSYGIKRKLDDLASRHEPLAILTEENISEDTIGVKTKIFSTDGNKMAINPQNGDKVVLKLRVNGRNKSIVGKCVDFDNFKKVIINENGDGASFVIDDVYSGSIILDSSSVKDRYVVLSDNPSDFSIEFVDTYYETSGLDQALKGLGKEITGIKNDLLPYIHINRENWKVLEDDNTNKVFAGKEVAVGGMNLPVALTEDDIGGEVSIVAELNGKKKSYTGFVSKLENRRIVISGEKDNGIALNDYIEFKIIPSFNIADGYLDASSISLASLVDRDIEDFNIDFKILNITGRDFTSKKFIKDNLGSPTLNDGYHNTILGDNSVVIGSSSIAIGYNSEVGRYNANGAWHDPASYAVSIGYDSEATADGTISIGCYSSANSSDSIAIGTSASSRIRHAKL